MTHQITEALEVISGAFDDVAEVNPLFMSASVRSDAIRDAFEVRARLDELILRMMVDSAEVVCASADRDIAAWTRHTARLSIDQARRMQALALDLDRNYPLVAAGMREGAVNIEQARAIVEELNELPAEIGSTVLAKAEAAQVEHAARFDPHQLRRLGRKILDVVAPEIAEDIEANRLAALENAADTRSRLTLRPQGDGTTRISGLIPDKDATRLAGYLFAFTNPRVAAGEDADPRPDGGTILRLAYPRRLGDAFCQFLETVDPQRLPIQAGDATTLVVTISLESLRAELGTAQVLGTSGSGHDTITAAQARRLACNAALIPAVLGAQSQLLDLGKAKRLFSAGQRRALLLSHPQCQAERCTIPGTWCEAHHWLPWSQGGATDLKNAVLLCAHHHHRAHDPRYETERLLNGDIRYTRRR